MIEQEKIKQKKVNYKARKNKTKES